MIDYFDKVLETGYGNSRIYDQSKVMLDYRANAIKSAKCVGSIYPIMKW